MMDFMQVIFGGAGSAGILGDLWLFDTITRSVHTDIYSLQLLLFLICL